MAELSEQPMTDPPERDAARGAIARDGDAELIDIGLDAQDIEDAGSAQPVIEAPPIIAQPATESSFTAPGAVALPWPTSGFAGAAWNAIPARPVRPPVWPVFVIVTCTVIVATIAQVIAGIVAAMATVTTQPQGDRSFDDVLATLFTAENLIIMLAPSQVIMLIGAIIGARVARGPSVVRTLGLNRPRGPWWLTMMLGLATIAIFGCVGGVFWSIVPESLIDDDPFAQAVINATPQWRFALIAFMSLTPGIMEELLFRGYLQGRLIPRWNPWLGVLTSTGIFIAAHIAPLQAISIIPMGLWLGVIAWRTNSIWPCMLCHAVNNAFAFTAYALHEEFGHNDSLRQAWHIILIASVPALIASCFMLWRIGRPHCQPATAAGPDEAPPLLETVDAPLRSDPAGYSVCRP